MQIEEIRGEKKRLFLSLALKNWSEHDLFLLHDLKQVLFGICSVVWMIICFPDFGLEQLKNEGLVSQKHTISVPCGHLLNHGKFI